MMRNRTTSAQSRAASFLALSCVGFIATAPGHAMAQDSAGEPVQLKGVTVQDTAIDDSYKVEKVQSPKTTAPIIDTPRTINVITGEVLADTASFSFADALRTVPGITLGGGEGGTASADIPIIRGTDATSDTFIDGARDPGSQTRDTFDVESIEVYKGPNSGFGGRGSAGGSINLVTKAPKAEDFVNLDLTGGTSDFRRATVDINKVVAENVAIRLNGLWHDANTAGRDDVWTRRWGIAPSVTIGLDSPTSMTLSYYHYETDGMPDYGIPLTSRGQLAGGVRRPADVDYDNFYGLTQRDFQHTRVDSLQMQARHDFGGGWVLTDTARWGSSRNNYVVTNPDDSRGNVANGLVYRSPKSRDSRNDNFVNNINLAGQLNTGGIAHSLAIGAETSVSDTNRYTYTVTNENSCATTGATTYNCTSLDNPTPHDAWTGTIVRSTVPTRTTAEDYSVYAFDTMTIVPQVLINGGIRWTSFHVKASGPAGRSPAYSVSRTSQFWSWQVGAVYKPVENASLYVSYANSKTPPGTDVGEGSDAISGSNSYYKPQGTKNLEAGAKFELFDGALMLTGSVFQIDRSNIQNPDPDATIDTQVIANKARIRGFELGASGKAGPVTLLAGYSYLDSKLRDGSVNDGNALPYAAKGNLTMTAKVDVTPRISVGGGVYHATRIYADAANLISAPGYWRADANAGFQVTDNIGLRLNVLNMFDKRYISKIRNPHYAVPAQGRQALLTLSVRY